MKVIEFNNGMIMRMCMLMTHYRSPINWSQQRWEEATKALTKFGKFCIPTDKLPPLELIECLTQELNTPKALSLLHKYCKEKRGEDIYASLKFMGFFPNEPMHVDEIKTLPKEHADGSNHPQLYSTHST